MPVWARPIIVLVSALALAGLTARLGFWQLDRAQQKLALQAARDAADAQPPVQDLDSPGLDHRRAQVEGQWRPDLQFWLGNRPHDQQVGFVLMTPLQLTDGRLIWVQRGWAPRRSGGWEAPPWPETSATVVRVQGRLRPQASLAYDLGSTGAIGTVRQNLDLSSSPEPGRRLAPWVLWQTQDCAPLRCDWPAPALGVDKHHGYAAQWFALSLLTCGLYVWFQLIAPRRRARAAR